MKQAEQVSEPSDGVWGGGGVGGWGAWGGGGGRAVVSLGGAAVGGVGERFFEAFKFLDADALCPAVSELIEDLLAGGEQVVALGGDGEPAASWVSLVGLAADVAALFKKADGLSGGLL